MVTYTFLLMRNFRKADIGQLHKVFKNTNRIEEKWLRYTNKIIWLYYIIKLDNQIPHPALKFKEDSHGKPNEQLFSKKKTVASHLPY